MKKNNKARKGTKAAKPAAKRAAKAIVKKEVAAKPYKIESGIPVSEPVLRNGDGGPSRVMATTNLMNVGDSFLIKDEIEGMRVRKSIRDLLRRERLSGGKRKFVVRRLKNGMRVWRTA